MDMLAADIRYALRSFRMAPAFFSLVIGILAVGIAASVSIFSLVDGILLRPLPYRNPGRLVTLTTYAPRPPFESNGSVTYADFQQFKAKSRSFEDLAFTFRTGWSRVTLTGGGVSVPMQGAFVSPNLFSLFGRSPLLGRTFTAHENLRKERVVVISEGLWAQRFARSPDALGKDLEIGHVRWQVIGVMPSDFQVPFLGTQLWAPVLSRPEWNTEETDPLKSTQWDVMARLKPAVSIFAAQAEVNAIWKRLRTALPEPHENDIQVVPLREHFTGSVRKPMLVLFGAVAFLLLIACANVANLLLARAAQRQRELTVRTALGAGHVRILRQLVTESITYSLIAGVLGIAASFALVPVLKAIAPANVPLLREVGVNSRALLFALAISISVGVLLGVAPAWRISRRDWAMVLNTAGRGMTERASSRRAKNVLVAAEFALAMVLLTGAGLLIRSFIAVLNVNPGFHVENVLTIQMGAPSGTPPQVAQFYREIMQRIRTLPGVEAVGAASTLFYDDTRTHALRLVEGRPAEPKSAWKQLVWTQITGDYFQAMGIPLLRGRTFNDHDRPDAAPVVIVNEALAHRYWPGEDPIGKRVKGFDPRGQHDDWLTVVGLVKDVRSGGLEKAPYSQIYEVQSQRGETTGNLVIRTAADPTQVAAAARSVIRRVNPEVVISSTRTMEQLLSGQETQRRFQTWLIGVFSAIALALAALGVFALMHYSVAARTAEIGIRMAVGARSNDIVRLILSNGARLACGGITVGAIAAMWTTEAIAGMLFKVTPEDPVTFGGAGFILFLVALLACYLPARRASRVDPMSALREN